MGVDTHLYISNRFEVEDIKTVLESYCKAEKITIINSHIPSMFSVTFEFEGKQQNMFIHHSHLPTGPVLLLSLGHNEQAIRIMRTIGEAIGGILEENDCNGKMETISGNLSDENGLQYFLKWAILNNRIPCGTVPELNQAIHDWHDDMKNTDRSKYQPYPKV